MSFKPYEDCAWCGEEAVGGTFSIIQDATGNPPHKVNLCETCGEVALEGGDYVQDEWYDEEDDTFLD